MSIQIGVGKALSTSTDRLVLNSASASNIASLYSAIGITQMQIDAVSIGSEYGTFALRYQGEGAALGGYGGPGELLLSMNSNLSHFYYPVSFESNVVFDGPTTFVQDTRFPQLFANNFVLGQGLPAAGEVLYATNPATGQAIMGLAPTGSLHLAGNVGIGLGETAALPYALTIAGDAGISGQVSASNVVVAKVQGPSGATAPFLDLASPSRGVFQGDFYITGTLGAGLISQGSAGFCNIIVSGYTHAQSLLLQNSAAGGYGGAAAGIALHQDRAYATGCNLIEATLAVASNVSYVALQVSTSNYSSNVGGCNIQIVGTTSNYVPVAYTCNVLFPGLTLDYAGRLGIGTSAPGAVFDLWGMATTDPTSVGAGLYGGATAGTCNLVQMTTAQGCNVSISLAGLMGLGTTTPQAPLHAVVQTPGYQSNWYIPGISVQSNLYVYPLVASNYTLACNVITTNYVLSNFTSNGTLTLQNYTYTTYVQAYNLTFSNYLMSNVGSNGVVSVVAVAASNYVPACNVSTSNYVWSNLVVTVSPYTCNYCNVIPTLTPVVRLDQQGLHPGMYMVAASNNVATFSIGPDGRVHIGAHDVAHALYNSANLLSVEGPMRATEASLYAISPLNGCNITFCNMNMMDVHSIGISNITSATHYTKYFQCEYFVTCNFYVPSFDCITAASIFRLNDEIIWAIGSNLTMSSNQSDIPSDSRYGGKIFVRVDEPDPGKHSYGLLVAGNTNTAIGVSAANAPSYVLAQGSTKTYLSMDATNALVVAQNDAATIAKMRVNSIAGGGGAGLQIGTNLTTTYNGYLGLQLDTDIGAINTASIAVPKYPLDMRGQLRVRTLSNLPALWVDGGDVKNPSTSPGTGRVGIGTTAPVVSLHVATTDAMLVPTGTLPQRPSTQQPGMIRYNTTLSTFEGYGPGGTWGSLGGVKSTDQATYIKPEGYPGANDGILYFVNCNVETMRIVGATCNVGIGTQAPTSRLHVQGSVYVSSNVRVGGSVLSTSDARLKTDLRPIDGALLRIGSLTGYTFSRMDLGGERQAGLIAQEVAAVLPEAVPTPVADGDPLRIAYDQMSALYVQAIRELLGRVERLEAEVAALRG